MIDKLGQSAIRSALRVVGAAQSRFAGADGVAPNQVITALRKATTTRPSKIEKAWVERIEASRRLLAGSTEPLEIEDFGAGKDHKFDLDGSVTTRHTVTKSVGSMTAASKPPRWAYLLFRIIREVKPASAIEMGACVGISASYQAAALEINGTGQLISLEGSDALARRSQHTLDELNLGERGSVMLGQFADTLDAAITQLSPVGYAFIDGHHVESATLDYTERLLPHLAPESVVIYDDIAWSDGMRKAWGQIEADERFALTIDLHTVGIAVVSASAKSRSTLSIRYG